MALPVGVSGKTLVFGNTGVFFDGTIVTGRVTVIAPTNVIHTPTGTPIFAGAMTRPFVNGVATFTELVPTDQPNLSYYGWSYRALVQVNGSKPEIFDFLIRVADTSPIDGDGLTPVPSSAGTPISVDVVSSGVVKAGIVVHGSDPNVARPSTTQPVVWFGTVDPVNADDTKDVTVPLGLDDGTGLHVGVSDVGVAALVADPLSGTTTALRAAFTNKADLVAGVVPDAELPTRLGDSALRAAFGSYRELAANPDSIIAGAITRDANGAATSAPVVWPDGTAGLYTATTVSTAFPGAVDAYTITYGSPATKTWTQSTVTRDANGAVTQRPALTVA